MREPRPRILCNYHSHLTYRTGQWGISSNTVYTTGSANTTCVGLVSSTKTQAQIQQEAQARAQTAAEASRQHTLRLILGLTLGLGIPAVLSLALLLYFHYRPRKNPHEQGGIWDDQDAAPRPWRLPSGDDTEMREVDAASQYVSTPQSHKSGYVGPDSPSATPLMQVTPLPPVYFEREIAQAGTSTSAASAASGTATGSSGSQSTPTTSAPDSARTRKYREALRDPQHGARPKLASPRPVRMNPLPPPLLGAGLDPDTQPDIIIQHRDGGSGIVQELPPPYADRSAAHTPADTPHSR